MNRPVKTELMASAIELSRQGFPAPNPHVGCVIERDGEIVGQGFHDHAGGPHAEIEALADAGERAKGATAYVTLEPCNHHGRTGPCSEALIAAQVSRVVIACKDPNPRASGGADRLRQAGIEVLEGVLTKEASAANEAWLTAMAFKRPFVVLKAAISLDGRIALPSGESQWITGEESRRETHVLRAECGAVLVGRETVHRDDPQLTVRHTSVQNQPMRIVLDPKNKLGPNHRIFDSAAPTLHVVEKPTGGEMGCPLGADGFDLKALVDQLFAKGITGVLVEGGSRTLASFVKAALWDRLELFVAPKILGDGPGWVNGLGLQALADAEIVKIDEMRRLGDDLWIRGRPNRPS